MTDRLPSPTGRPAAARLSLVLAILLIGAAVVTGHDAAVALGQLSGSSWLLAALSPLDGLSGDSVAVLAVGIGAAAIAVLILLVALLPAPKTHRPSDLASHVWISDRALSAAAVAAAENVPGVASAVVRVKRSKLAVTVHSDREHIADTVRDAITRHVGDWGTHTIKITTRRLRHDA